MQLLYSMMEDRKQIIYQLHYADLCQGRSGLVISSVRWTAHDRSFIVSDLNENSKND